MSNNRFTYQYEYTPEELEALRSYKYSGSIWMNCILNDGYDVELSYNVNDSIDSFILMGIESPEKSIDTICNMYAAIYKSYKRNIGNNSSYYVYRGTTTQEVSRLQKLGIANKALSTTGSERRAIGSFAMPWRNNAAVVKVKLTSDVPYLDYSDVVGRATASGEKIDNLSEDETVIAPFCEINFSEGTNTYVRGHGYIPEYYATVKKSQLEEISDEAEQEHISFLKSHCKEVSDFMTKLVEYTYTKECMDAEFQLRNLRLTLREERTEDGRQWVLDRINEQEERIRKSKEEETKEETLVNEFKTRLRAVCKSRCRKMEKIIDLDYDEKKQQFEIAKIEEEKQRKIEQKRNVLSSASGVCNTISEDGKVIESIKQYKQQIESMAARLGLTNVNYIEEVDSMTMSNQALLQKAGSIHRIIKEYYDGIEDPLKATAGDQIEDGIINAISMGYGYKSLERDYKEAQNNEILNEINNKIIEYQAQADYDKLQAELTEIKNRSTLSRIRDFFAKKSRRKKERAVQIEGALEIIKKKMEVVRSNPTFPESSPEYVISRIYTFEQQLKNRAANKRISDTDLQDLTEKIEIMKSFINSNFSLDAAVVTERCGKMEMFRGIPPIVQRGETMTEEQLMGYFLEKNGYTGYNSVPDQNQSKRVQSIKDEIDRRIIWCKEKDIQSKRAIERISQCLDVENSRPERNALENR